MFFTHLISEADMYSAITLLWFDYALVFIVIWQILPPSFHSGQLIIPHGTPALLSLMYVQIAMFFSSPHIFPLVEMNVGWAKLSLDENLSLLVRITRHCLSKDLRVSFRFFRHISTQITTAKIQENYSALWKTKQCLQHTTFPSDSFHPKTQNVPEQIFLPRIFWLIEKEFLHKRKTVDFPRGAQTIKSPWRKWEIFQESNLIIYLEIQVTVATTYALIHKYITVL